MNFMQRKPLLKPVKKSWNSTISFNNNNSNAIINTSTMISYSSYRLGILQSKSIYPRQNALCNWALRLIPMYPSSGGYTQTKTVADLSELFICQTPTTEATFIKWGVKRKNKSRMLLNLGAKQQGKPVFKSLTCTQPSALCSTLKHHPQFVFQDAKWHAIILKGTL